MASKARHTKPFYNSAIPSDWEVMELGKITEKIGDGLHGTPEYISSSEYFFINGNNLKKGGIQVSEGTKCVSRDEYLKHKKNLKYKSILLSINGTIGSVAFYRDEKIVLGKSAAYINCKDENVDFLYYYLQSQSVINFFEGELTGSTIRNLSLKSIREIPIPLPPLPEQRAIAHILGLMDTAINKNNSLIAKKELQKKWLMQNILTGKQRLRGFDKDWKMYRIEELFEKVFRYVEWSDESLYKLVSLRRRYGGLFERGDFFGSQIEVKKIKSINHKDFLISKRQVSHGAWGIVTPEFHDRKVSDEYDSLIVKDNGKLLIDFWDWFSKIPLLSHYAFLASNGVHIEKLIFDFDTFKRRRVLIPSTIEEQTAIAQVLQAADKEIQLLKVKTEKLREQKKGLMQVLLTGKKRLTI